MLLFLLSKLEMSVVSSCEGDERSRVLLLFLGTFNHKGLQKWKKNTDICEMESILSISGCYWSLGIGLYAANKERAALASLETANSKTSLQPFNSSLNISASSLNPALLNLPRNQLSLPRA